MRTLEKEPLPRVLSFPVPEEEDEQNCVYALKVKRNDLDTVKQNKDLNPPLFVMEKTIADSSM